MDPSRRIEQKLRIEQDGSHHERGQMIVSDALLGKRGGQGEGAVHAQRRSDSQQAGRDNAQPAPSAAAYASKSAMNPAFSKHRYRRSQQDAQRPVGQNLAKLNVEVIPQVNSLALNPVRHRCLPTYSRGCQSRWFPYAPRCAGRCGSRCAG